MYIAGFRILFLAENEITSKGVYVSNLSRFFDEAFFNGTVNGVANNTILTGATYSDLVSSVNTKGAKINVDISMTNSSLVVTQSDPWNVNLTLVSDFVMEDREELAKWEKKQRISVLIPITFFEDPLFTINSLARISKKFSITPYEGAYSVGGVPTGLVDHFDKSYYAANPKAPSFLKRLEGDLSPDTNGVESFVKKSEFSAQGLGIFDKTSIDYIYFDSSSNPASHGVTGMPSLFKIDGIDDHDIKYGV